jgi:nitrate reductase NapE
LQAVPEPAGAAACFRAVEEGITMSTDARDELAQEPLVPTRRRELLAFLLLSVLIWPVIAVGVVAGYGFLVWMHHAFIGLPGPH